MSPLKLKLGDLMGHIEIHSAPPRVEGNDLIMRGRTVRFDGAGNVTSDETRDTVRIQNGAHPQFEGFFQNILR